MAPLTSLWASLASQFAPPLPLRLCHWRSAWVAWRLPLRLMWRLYSLSPALLLLPDAPLERLPTTTEYLRRLWLLGHLSPMKRRRMSWL